MISRELISHPLIQPPPAHIYSTLSIDRSLLYAAWTVPPVKPGRRKWLWKVLRQEGEGNESERNAELPRKVVIDSFPTPSICRVGCRVHKLEPSPNRALCET